MNPLMTWLVVFGAATVVAVVGGEAAHIRDRYRAATAAAIEAIINMPPARSAREVGFWPQRQHATDLAAAYVNPYAGGAAQPHSAWHRAVA